MGVGFERRENPRENHTPGVELAAVVLTYAELVVQPGLVEDAGAD